MLGQKAPEQVGPVPWEYIEARLILWTGWTLDELRRRDLWEMRRLYCMFQLIESEAHGR